MFLPQLILFYLLINQIVIEYHQHSKLVVGATKILNYYSKIFSMGFFWISNLTIYFCFILLLLLSLFKLTLFVHNFSCDFLILYTLSWFLLHLQLLSWIFQLMNHLLLSFHLFLCSFIFTMCSSTEN